MESLDTPVIAPQAQIQKPTLEAPRRTQSDALFIDGQMPSRWQVVNDRLRHRPIVAPPPQQRHGHARR